MLDERQTMSWRALYFTYGLIPIVAGFDKFTNLLTNWTQYLSPLALQVVPVTATQFMYGVGVIEIVAGALVFTRFTRIAAYVISAWLVAIAVNLISTGHYFDIAVRDLTMAVGAFALAKMTEARAGAPAFASKRTTRGFAAHSRA